MKSTGVVRLMDELGRIVIPKDFRRLLCIREKDPLEFYVDNDNTCIVLKKYEPFCTFCGNSEDVFEFNGKNVCKNCVKALQQKSESKTND